VIFVKPLFPLAALFVALCSMPLQAENVIRVAAPVAKASPTQPTEQWIPDAPIYSEWVNSGDFYDCTSMTPDAADISVNASFIQSFSGCSQDQERTVQATVKSSLTGEIKNSGAPVVEYQTLLTQSGTRTTQGKNNTGVMTYAITPGKASGLGAGYYKQNGGGYNFGTAMQKTSNGYQTYFAVIYYGGSYTVQFAASTGAALNASNNTKYDSSPFSSYIQPYKGVRLLASDNTVLYEFNFQSISDIRNYYIKYANITAAQYNAVYANIGQVAKVQLFE
jgi:hypothetical protein